MYREGVTDIDFMKVFAKENFEIGVFEGKWTASIFNILEEQEIYKVVKISLDQKSESLEHIPVSELLIIPWDSYYHQKERLLKFLKRVQQRTAILFMYDKADGLISFLSHLNFNFSYQFCQFDIDENTLKKVIQQFEYQQFLTYSSQVPYLKFNHRGGFKLKYIPDIIYFEAKGNHTLITTRNNSEQFLIGIGKLTNMLPTDQFKRVHRKFIINLDYLREIDKASKYCYLEFDNHRYRIDINEKSMKELDTLF